MKIFAFDRRPGSALLLPPSVELLADSAVVAPDRPLFLPDFDTDWEAHFYLCGRVSRLGKDIALKFAPRYFDAVSLAMRLVPRSLVNDFRLSGRQTGLLGVFDCCLQLGQWQTVDPTTADDKPLTVTVGQATQTIDDPLKAIAESLSAISRYATLKTGDLLLALHLDFSLPATVGDNVTATLASTPVLSARIK